MFWISRGSIHNPKLLYSAYFKNGTRDKTDIMVTWGTFHLSTFWSGKRDYSYLVFQMESSNNVGCMVWNIGISNLFSLELSSGNLLVGEYSIHIQIFFKQAYGNYLHYNVQNENPGWTKNSFFWLGLVLSTDNCTLILNSIRISKLGTILTKDMIKLKSKLFHFVFIMISTYVFKLLQLVTIQFTFIFLKYLFSNKAIFVIFILSITYLFHVTYGIIPTKNKFGHAILMGLYKAGCISFILHNDLFVLTLNIFSYQNEDLSGNLYNSTIKTEIYE